MRLAALRSRIQGVAGSGKAAMRDLIEEDHRVALSAVGSGGAASGTADDDSWLIPGLGIGPCPILNRVSLTRSSDAYGGSGSADSAPVPVDTPIGFLGAVKYVSAGGATWARVRRADGWVCCGRCVADGWVCCGRCVADGWVCCGRCVVVFVVFVVFVVRCLAVGTRGCTDCVLWMGFDVPVVWCA